MDYALVATDFDGTLLPIGHDEILPRTREAIRRVRRQGVRFVIVSGRATTGLLNITRKFDIDTDGLYLIGFNGASAVQAWDGTTLFSHRLDLALARQVIARALAFDVVVMVPEGAEVFTNRPDSYAVAFETGANGTTSVELADPSVIGFAPCKVLLGGDHAELVRLEADLVSRFGEQTEILFSADFLLEVNARGVTKGEALAGLCEALGIPVERSIAFGDNHNDIPMLKAAGLGVAMANGVPEALAAADRVTLADTEDGVAVVLDELIPG